MSAPDLIHQLVEQFEQNKVHFKSLQFKETDTRVVFIDRFFAALGWDMTSPQQIVRELSVDVEENQRLKRKFPDYGFYIDRNLRFFVEAKAPHVDIKENKDAAFQVRRYGWSAKLPASILTDFEEFSIYDCRLKPANDDKPTEGRLRRYTYTEYVDKWDEIAELISYEAVRANKLDEWVRDVKTRGIEEVDKAFLDEMEKWRVWLAKDIVLHNPHLQTNIRQLNMAVQLTIDRLVFLRICEDRDIELYGRLDDIRKSGGIYEQLKQFFLLADQKYNSGLFHFSAEKGRDEPDTLTPTLHISDEPLHNILKSLYPPASPYAFNVLPADILGQIYERFLGKVVEVSASGAVEVVEKPEVRKAGGVFYTPTYIVDYIVTHTVGALLQGKTPDEVSKLRILDPACGSGSFLIGAFDLLIDWHLAYYVTDGAAKHLKARRIREIIRQQPSGAKMPDAMYRVPTNNDPVGTPYMVSAADPTTTPLPIQYTLTTNEKKRILLNNLYGVDLDQQAVEVTKLSLLLKVLEGETGSTAQPLLMTERVLPDLGDNVRWGNSLIGPDFYSNKTVSLFPEEELYRVKVFDWRSQEDGFGKIMNAGGFDAVIGNPPYLRIQGLQEYYSDQIPYFIKNYTSAVKRFDLYLLFAEHGFKLLKESGYLGYICPHKFTNSDFGSGLRKFFLDTSAVKMLISFGNNLIFRQVSTYTSILLLQKTAKKAFLYYEFADTPIFELQKRLNSLKPENFSNFKFNDLSEKPWILTSSIVSQTLRKLSSQPQTLEDVTAEIMVGVQSGIDNIHVVKAISNSINGKVKVFSERANQEIEIEIALLKPFLRGEDVHRYKESKFSYYVIYPYELIDGKTKILEEAKFQDLYPLGYSYLSEYRDELTEIRLRQKTNTKYWYSCHRSRDMQVFETKRIVTPEISLGCNLTIVPSGLYHNTKCYSIVISPLRRENMHYFLGLLNSKILWWYLSNTGYVLRGGYFVFKTEYLRPFPIRTINFDDPADKARHDRLVALVEQMLDLHKQAAAAENETIRKTLKAVIDTTDREIDALVYELYALTPDEIALVEGRGVTA